jgi:hypothetical protein
MVNILAHIKEKVTGRRKTAYRVSSELLTLA